MSRNRTTHGCPRRGCRQKVRARDLLCAAHWKEIPSPLQVSYIEAYQQDQNGYLSPPAQEARRKVVEYLCALEARESHEIRVRREGAKRR